MSFVPRTPEDLAASWPAELDHVSASSLKQFARCPEQWRQVRVLGRRQRPAGAIIQGKADHHAIGQHFAAQVKGGGLATDQVQDAFVTKFEEEIADAGITEIEWGKETLSATAARAAASKIKDAGVLLVAAYHTEVGPYFQATQVEEQFQVEVPGVPMRIDGYIDAQGVYISPFTQEPVDDVSVTIERKTAARAGMQPETVLQARMYQLVHPQDVDVHVSVKRGYIEWGTPALRVTYTPTRHDSTVEMVAQMLRTIGFYYSTYGPDHVWPGAIVHPWACGYCGFRADCQWWAA